MSVLQKITNAVGKIAVLIDPEKKATEEDLIPLLRKINTSKIDFIFIGGSTEKKINLDSIISIIKHHTNLPVIIFPGNYSQVSSFADAILFLTFLSSKNPKYLIEQQIKSAPLVFNSKIEVLPTGYVLLDGENESSTSKLTGVKPLKITNKKNLLNISLAGKFSGKKILLFDNGSGAKKSIQNSYIKEIKSKTELPIIVGGGIKSTKEIITLKKLGVNIIIVGNIIENNLSFLDEISSL